MKESELKRKLEGEVFGIIIDNLDIKEEELTIESHFKNDFNADSLDLVELVMGFEEKYDINIMDEEAEKLQTTKAILDYMVDHVDAYKSLKGLYVRDNVL